MKRPRISCISGERFASSLHPLPWGLHRRKSQGPRPKLEPAEVTGPPLNITIIKGEFSFRNYRLRHLRLVTCKDACNRVPERKPKESHDSCGGPDVFSHIAFNIQLLLYREA